jgi:hypothetical protein
MAKSPPFKVYRNGEYVAACWHAEDAAAIAGMSAGTQVRWGHSKVVFTEPASEEAGVKAADSWDAAANLIRARVEELTNAN